MPKSKIQCPLCGKILKNREDAQTVHDRTCSRFKRLHQESVQYIQQHLANQSQLPAETPMEIDHPPPPALPPPPSPPATRPSGLPNRRTRVPSKFNDAAPPRPPRLRRRDVQNQISQPPLASPPSAPSPAPFDAAPSPPPPPKDWVQTLPNAFGLYKIYPRRPTHDPDESVGLSDLYRVPKPGDPALKTLPLPPEPWYYPFPNESVAHMIKYHVEEEHPQSIAGFDRLVTNFLHPNEEAQSDGISLHELPTPFSTQKFLDQLDKNGITPLGITDKWKNASVTIRLPCVGVNQSETAAPCFTVNDILHRPLLDPIKEVLQGPLFQRFHTTPFSLRAIPESDLLSPVVADDAPTLNEYGLPPLLPDHEEIFSEIYTSPAMLEAYHAIPQPPAPQTPDDAVESIVVALMMWSDATHLAQFGTASLWPGYTFFGNHPKEFRGKPTSNAGFHQVYFASLPDSVRDSYRQQYGCDMPDEVYTHLKRELIHAIWELLLSDEFMDAYDNGIKIKCWDGLVRLVFPRFLIYGADYPEKVLLATIRSFGGCPCPRCFIQKGQIMETGTVNDMKRRSNIRVDDHPRRSTIESARAAIFGNGNAVAGSAIDKMLKAQSWAPTRASIYHTHIIRFAHLPRMLSQNWIRSRRRSICSQCSYPTSCMKSNWGSPKPLSSILFECYTPSRTSMNLTNDARFRQVPTFGRSTIRSFCKNVSELKYAAARNYEDIIQCILPVLEGLFPKHQALIDKLAFELAIWHGYAKLRMHTTSTIQLFRLATKDLCTTIRRFARETVNVKTYELPRETRRRMNRPSKASPPNLSVPAPDNLPIPSASSQSATQAVATPPTSKKKKTPAQKLEKPFNLITYKLHSIPDYPDAIVRFGTTDSTSTQNGEVAHRLVKYLYQRTNKREHVRQIAKHEQRRRLMRAMWERRRRYKEAEKGHVNPSSASNISTYANSTISHKPIKNRRERLRTVLCPKATYSHYTYVPPEQHHYISDSTRTSIRLSDLVDTDLHSDTDTDGGDGPMAIDRPDPVIPDPALHNFTRKLKSHLRQRLLGSEYDGDDTCFTDEELINVVLEKDTLYSHATLRVNFTTYDLRRDQDVINPRSRKFCIVAGQDPQNRHELWYGEVLGIFHTRVLLADQPNKARRMEFLWMRWLQRDVTYRCGLKAKRLPRVHYMPHDVPDTFGFLDPSDIIRGCHLIPAFAHGRTTQYLPKSMARQASEQDQDWKYFYVNMVVDRDMMMRYHDRVIGHRKTRAPISNPTTEQEQITEEVVDDVVADMVDDVVADMAEEVNVAAVVAEEDEGEEGEPDDWVAEGADFDTDSEHEEDEGGEDEDSLSHATIVSRLGYDSE
ncbi:hypothetical protein MIND_01124000 [Mycena indigotica]|uniref:Uncharacterized protein n=1 Tax=Mycena indigotica TaxID=2126181 RepID=A0A8H6VX72_9AGAR|nr:uncharacterized protein MIND_01124000 [Mycena indigotica]KAF7293463.1 hypothetical protein MIND_01124000 [Mycena indigotica]